MDQRDLDHGDRAGAGGGHGRRDGDDAGRHQRHRRRRPVHLRAPAPTVTGVSPNTGPTAGGTSVTITGTNFTGATAVKFGGTAATVVHGQQRHLDHRDVAGAAAGTVDVTVTTPGGTSATGAADQFTYVTPAPTVTGVSPNSRPDGRRHHRSPSPAPTSPARRR